MILILAGGGREAQSVSERLRREGMAHICLFSTFHEAGSYGRGNAIVGRLDRRAMEDLLEKEKIHGVVDLEEGNHGEQSRATIAACKNRGIPYIKRLHLPVPREELHGAYMVGSYDAVAERINRQSKVVLLYTGAEAAGAIAKRVYQPDCLYTPILRGIRFDVELALEFGIPLINVIEADSIDGADAVREVIARTKAGMLVLDGTVNPTEKLLVAEELGIPALVTHRAGIEFPKTVWSGEELIVNLRTWKREERNGRK